ncbi:DUF350 domain-containing protein [Paenibacillus sp. PsM32]|uniref:DUF350 domain-containing protein n=1 Tax=Paenibacillus kyungheensis TaxID=1452732 RepID=A0AAX3LVQ5_9BACL|nr:MULTISPECIES: DUF350 domain-containing protein [Paenibacillus]MDN4618405.1 DUF350 domain-containing protein [Paenibacillus sp. PsM32]MDQ1234431.1 uncharacterized membrane protein YjfL (UPF0719 family) [Paenibacillus sp. SORGH_AS_0306]MDR6111478.1 uncharacterized membrane protein YjfL (UPF0719 family) [Paenibacillus sp. SORGH_AS_0338]WCT54039.1 DUF350 domain-containing protein [Paenibacillus kyungheensis]WDF52952.1 DUF350 domain-containing protein [Paenibacillus sp. KACC 21273]
MSWNILGSIAVWTAVGAVLLFVLMYVDSLFTKYKDIAEIKAGNNAVATRLVMKLFAQGYILSVAIGTSWSLGEAVLVSVVSFVILLILELIVRFLLKQMMGLDLDEGTKQGQIGYGLLGGALQIVGALIISASL